VDFFGFSAGGVAAAVDWEGGAVDEARPVREQVGMRDGIQSSAGATVSTADAQGLLFALASSMGITIED
jgi:hypothetical protein